jgi:hypothetical protein
MARSGAVILIAGVECAEGKEKEFNESYNASFPPVVMRVPGVVRVDRYERLNGDETLPRFLSIVHLEDESAIERMAESDTIRELADLYVEQGARFDTKVQWASHYRLIFSTGPREARQ